MGWSSQVLIASVVIVEGTDDGVFVYSGAPALGNLIVSLAAQAGVDAYGNAYPQGINVTTGVIAGTTITGSTFDGTDFVLNSSGMFFYSSTPALGNLIASISNNGGSDSFGNAYVAGFGSYGTGLFAQLDAGKVVTGAIAAGVPDTADAGGLFTDTSGVITELLGISTATGATTNPVAIELFAGDINQTTGATGAPQLYVSDVAGNSAADIYLSGTLIKTNDISSRYIWHTPSFGTGWADTAIRSGRVLQYRLDALDNIMFAGSLNTTSATPANPIFTLTGAYVPKSNQSFTVIHQNSAGTLINICTGFYTSGGVFEIFSAGTITTGDIFTFNALLPLGNIV